MIINTLFKSYTRLTVSLNVFVPKRLGHKDNPMGHTTKILQALAKRTPHLNTASVANTAQGASSNKPPVEERAPQIPALDEPSSEPVTKPSLKDAIAHVGAKIFNSVPTPNKTSGLIFKAEQQSEVSSSILHENSVHVQQNKQSLHTFAEHFKQIPDNQLDDQLVFIRWFKETFSNQPEVNTRAFQLAIEVSYKKKQFSEKYLHKVFEGQIGILDLTGSNNGFTDASTFYTFMQTYVLLKQLGAAKNIEMRIIISPPLKGNLKDLPPKILQILQEGQKATGNSINDIMLNNHYYDYKNTRDIAYNKNHIIYLDYSNFDTFSISQRYLVNLAKRFQRIVDVKVDLDQKPVTKEVHTYTKILSDKINALIKENSLSGLQKIIQWNAILFETWDIRPTDLYFPMIISTTERPFQPNPAIADDVTQIKLPISKILKPEDVYASLRDSCEKWDSSTKLRAYILTHGVLGSFQKPLPYTISDYHDNTD
jgi:hypothetical protein